METKQFAGYLPDERPPALKLFLYALQQVIVMFPATIAVALITGFQVSTTIFASGIATVAFVFITGGKIPMYYGSSFAYLTAVMSLVTSEAIMAKMSPEAVAQVAAWAAGESPVMPTEAIQFAQFGIIMSGFVSIAAGLIVKYAGRKAVETLLPPTITGSIAMVIGLTLAGNALSDAMPQAAAAGVNITGSNWVWAVSLITLLVTVLIARYAKGLISQLPLLFGVAHCLCGNGRLELLPQHQRRCPRQPVPAGQHLCGAGILTAQDILGGGAGHHANRHRHNPRVHGAYLSA